MRTIFLIMFVFEVTLAWAVVNTAQVTENLIIAETEEKDQARDAAQASKKEYRSKNYKVKEETDTVEAALNVFKNKGKSSSLYTKKVWLYNTLQDDNASYLSFMTNDQNASIVFSPDEEFVYYIEMTPDGQRRLNGVRISTQEQFFINPASSFFIETCEGEQNSYVIVTDDTASAYHVFDLNGTAVTLPDTLSDIGDLQNVICH